MNNCQKNFSQIYDQHIDKIYRFIFLRVSSQEVAEDLVSETFLRGWRVFKDDKKEIVNPSAFLYQIARNLVTDFYREKGKAQIVSAEIIPINDPRIDLEGDAMLRSDMEAVKKAIANLNEDYQNVVIWHYIDDLPVPEIAKIIGKPEGTVRVTLHRALKALRIEINNKQRTIEQS